MSETLSPHQQFTQLRATYLSQLPAKLQRLVEAWEQLAGDPTSPGLAEALYRQAHTLAGSGATFGYSELTEAARQVELTLAPLRAPNLSPAIAMPALGAISDSIQQLQVCAQALAQADQPPHLGLTDLPGPLPGAPASRRLLVVDGDLHSAQELAIQLSSFGYVAQAIGDLAAPAEWLWDAAPAAIILDLYAAGGGETIAAQLASRAQEAKPPIPIVYTCDQSDLEVRLQAVRQGGKAFFPKPVPVNDLVGALNQITTSDKLDPYRVLIVDDSPLVAHMNAAILRSAGMLATVVTDPDGLLPAMAVHTPDLLLLDLYMPSCTGQELAAVIRQQPDFQSLPIIYLSAETNRDLQQRAMDRGGDDFLTKPVQPAQLIAAVSSRIERVRAIRARPNRDGLTGLLPHVAVKDQLVRELARVQRYGTWLSVALIDLDHLTQINEQHGNATGDQVLLSLSWLLRQNLRASDVVGRYGGDELLVLLPETDGAGAQTVLERLRIRFAGIRHQADDQTITATFSAGIASIAPFSNPTDVVELAEVALYAAKQGGRHRIMRAETVRAPTAGPGGVQPGALHAPLIDGRPAPMRTLVVAEDPDLRAVLTAWLRGWAWPVETAGSSEAALALIATYAPDVVLLDALMPGVGCRDVLDHLHASDLQAALILTTAFSAEQLASSAIREGADDYVRKPLDPAELRMALERALGRLQLRRENARLRRMLDGD